MKRDIRLHGLSSDHHHALVLARRIRQAAADGALDAAFVQTVQARYTEELAPHFQVEEDLLLPALQEANETALVDRTLAEHVELRALLANAGAGQHDCLERFASLLEAHVRFEEQQLFGACERLLDESVLDQVAKRAPKPR